VVSNTSGSVSVLLAQGVATFSPQVSYAVSGEPRSISVGDLDGDGQPDLAIATIAAGQPFQPGTVVVMRNQGGGVFGTSAGYATGNSPVAVAVGDLNGDGLMDLIVANQYSSSVSVLLNECAPGQ
jgi:hypothetical protein